MGIDETGFTESLSAIMQDRLRERLGDLSVKILEEFIDKAKQDISLIIASLVLEIMNTAVFSTSRRELIIKVQLPEMKNV